MSNSATINARERELYRFFQPEGVTTGPDGERIPKSSSDPILTAFAQLGALRLNTKRGLITLSTGTSEFVIAESGQALSLQGDDDPNDKLWHGVGTFKCPTSTHKTIGAELVSHFCRTGNEYLIINDMTKDDVYKDKCVVKEDPHVRFAAAVPLLSPRTGIVVGVYVAVDNKPRSGLNEVELQLLLDLGTTVTDYLKSNLIKMKQYRAERMIKALSLLIEGKSSLRDWWLELGHKFQNPHIKKRSKSEVSLSQLADDEFGVQEPPSNLSNGLDDWRGSHGGDSLPSSSAASRAGHDFGDGRPNLPRATSGSDATGTTTLVSRTWHDRNSSATTFDTLTEPTTIDHPESRHSVSFDLPHQLPNDVSKELQDALLSSDLKSVFSRSSNLIREAIGVEGVVFFDASIGSFAGSVKENLMDEKAPGAFNDDKAPTSSEDEVGQQQFTPNLDVNSHSASKTEQPPEKCCNILGFSTRSRSSLRGHIPSKHHSRLPESILRRLLKKYPHGKVFNFDADGVYSSGDSDQTSGKENEPTSSLLTASLQDIKARRKRLSKEAEIKAILNVLPGARSVFWFPLWDNHRERWFAGSLVYSNVPTRVLCPEEDLTYLAAFGNSTMAEVARISSQVLDKMKSDFISSISHELRSPLHGVLASVEFLQETPLREDQEDMVNNIHASGKVLLDTINHVLDFSKVNKKAKSTKISKYTSRRRKNASKERRAGDDDVDETADVCILSEEVVESVYVGHSFTKAVLDPSARSKRTSMIARNLPITIVTDIAWHPNWEFEIDPGAWTRILMNLFGNAMKYTTSGFIKISLEFENGLSSRNRNERPFVLLRVKDSGKGIGKEFLKHRLYKPFTQEDSLAAGAGLGLSIVRHIIQDLGGQIDFVSEQGSGTEATVRIPLMASATQAKLEGTSHVAEVREIAKGFKYSLEAFDRYPDITETPTGILSAEDEASMLLKSSMQKLMNEWFGMKLANISPLETSADVVLIMESGIGNRSLKDILELYNHDAPTSSGKSTAIVLCSTYHPSPKIHSCESFQIYYVQQPFGPHKIAKILHKAFIQKLAPTAGYELDTHTGVKSPGTESVGSFPSPYPSPRPMTPPTEKLVNVSVSLKRSGAEQLSTETLDNVKAALPQTSTDDAKPKGLRVLLVEDNEINLKLLVATMRKLKIAHSTATNGLEALNAYKECRGDYDVILMDISMPIMSGIDSTRYIRRFEREEGLQPTRLIALTGAANPNTRQEAFSSGVDLFLTKPVPMKELRAMLEDIRKEATRILDETADG